MKKVKFTFKHVQYEMAVCEETGAIEGLILVSTGQDVLNDFSDNEIEYFDRMYNPVELD